MFDQTALFTSRWGDAVRSREISSGPTPIPPVATCLWHVRLPTGPWLQLCRLDGVSPYRLALGRKVKTVGNPESLRLTDAPFEVSGGTGPSSGADR